jgi:hypothetical protein
MGRGRELGGGSKRQEFAIIPRLPLPHLLCYRLQTLAASLLGSSLALEKGQKPAPTPTSPRRVIVLHKLQVRPNKQAKAANKVSLACACERESGNKRKTRTQQTPSTLLARGWPTGREAHQKSQRRKAGNVWADNFGTWKKNGSYGRQESQSPEHIMTTGQSGAPNA